MLTNLDPTVKYVAALTSYLDAIIFGNITTAYRDTLLTQYTTNGSRCDSKFDSAFISCGKWGRKGLSSKGLEFYSRHLLLRKSLLRLSTVKSEAASRIGPLSAEKPHQANARARDMSRARDCLAPLSHNPTWALPAAFRRHLCCTMAALSVGKSSFHTFVSTLIPASRQTIHEPTAGRTVRSVLKTAGSCPAIDACVPRTSFHNNNVIGECGGPLFSPFGRRVRNKGDLVGGR